MTIRGGCAEEVASANNVTFHTPSFLQKQETIFSGLNNSQMDAVFQRHDVRGGCTEKVVSTNNVTGRGYMKFLRNAVEQKFGWSEAKPYSRCCMMCLGGGLHSTHDKWTFIFFAFKLAHISAAATTAKADL